MNKKTLIQLILLLAIILLLGIFYFKYISLDSSEISKKQEINNSTLEKETTNLIKNIKYVVDDEFGNNYLIRAEYGEILDDNNFILMHNVKAFLNFNRSEEITIEAVSALYNVLDYDTKFKGDILVKYSEQEISCQKIDFLFKNQKINLYDNINYNNLNTSLLADKIEIDLVSQNTKIYMKNSNKKIKMVYKDNGNY